MFSALLFGSVVLNYTRKYNEANKKKNILNAAQPLDKNTPGLYHSLIRPELTTPVTLNEKQYLTLETIMQKVYNNTSASSNGSIVSSQYVGGNSNSTYKYAILSDVNLTNLLPDIHKQLAQDIKESRIIALHDNPKYSSMSINTPVASFNHNTVYLNPNIVDPKANVSTSSLEFEVGTQHKFRGVSYSNGDTYTVTGQWNGTKFIESHPNLIINKNKGINQMREEANSDARYYKWAVIIGLAVGTLAFGGELAFYRKKKLI